MLNTLNKLSFRAFTAYRKWRFQHITNPFVEGFVKRYKQHDLSEFKEGWSMGADMTLMYMESCETWNEFIKGLGGHFEHVMEAAKVMDQTQYIERVMAEAAFKEAWHKGWLAHDKMDTTLFN